MPTEAYIIFGACIAVMGISAFYLRDDSKSVMAAARVGIVMGGAALFLSALYYFSIMLAVLIVMLPIFLLVSWFQGLF